MYWTETTANTEDGTGYFPSGTWDDLLAPSQDSGTQKAPWDSSVNNLAPVTPHSDIVVFPPSANIDTLWQFVQPSLPLYTQGCFPGSDGLSPSRWEKTMEMEVANVDSFVNLRSSASFEANVVSTAALTERVTIVDISQVSIAGDGPAKTFCQSLCEKQKDTGRWLTEDDWRQLVTCVREDRLWYEVTNQSGQTGFVSGRFLGFPQTWPGQPRDWR